MLLLSRQHRCYVAMSFATAGAVVLRVVTEGHELQRWLSSGEVVQRGDENRAAVAAGRQRAREPDEPAIACAVMPRRVQREMLRRCVRALRAGAREPDKEIGPFRPSRPGYEENESEELEREEARREARQRQARVSLAA